VNHGIEIYLLTEFRNRSYTGRVCIVAEYKLSLWGVWKMIGGKPPDSFHPNRHHPPDHPSASSSPESSNEATTIHSSTSVVFSEPHSSAESVSISPASLYTFRAASILADFELGRFDLSPLGW
jgi:hypothetical protein